MANSQIKASTINAADYQAPGHSNAQAKRSLRSGHWLLMILALLCICFIVFLTLARSIQIKTFSVIDETSQEISAHVQLATWLKLPVGNRVLVIPGQHQVSALVKGYQPLSQDLDVGRDRHQQFNLELQPLPGQLEIKLNPAVEAQVLIDGEAAGSLPSLLENISAGVHQLSIDAPLYRTENRQVNVEGKGITQELEITLQAAWAEVTINSEPSNAEVFLDDKNIGQTPLVAKVEEGLRNLKIKADKFKPYNKEFKVIAQQNINLADIKLAPADGILKVTTEPTKAAVILNGEYQGTSPITLNLPVDKSQSVKIYKAGYKKQELAFTLAADQQQQQNFNLQQDLVSVRFSVTPNDANLYIDGIMQGAGSRTVKLNTMPHRVQVKKKGYANYEKQLTPTKNSAQVVSVKLLTKEQKFWANVPHAYESTAGQQMKLFKSPGLVKMGSARREAGRRANEVAYSANLSKHFYVSSHEVTNKQFRVFDANHNSGSYKSKSLDGNKHPVANVSWQQAALYCNWLSGKESLTPFYQTEAGFVAGHNSAANGYRLLTEAEWAWLARNNSKSPTGVMIYPWGDNPQLLNSKAVGNFGDVSAKSMISFFLEGYNDDYKAASPVGRFAVNHRGLYDMGGNVSEWVNDWYSANADISKQTKSALDPLGPSEGEFHVIRGGSWAKGHLPQLRLAYRDYGAKGKHDVGFRIARYVQ